MTDEEKKAVEELKILKTSEFGLRLTPHGAEVFLNLIEKQDKIIKDKDQVHEYDVKMIDEVKGEYVKLAKEDGEIIEKQDKKIKLLKEQNEYVINEYGNTIEEQRKIIQAMAKMLVEDHEWFYSEFDDYTAEDFIKYFEKEGK